MTAALACAATLAGVAAVLLLLPAREAAAPPVRGSPGSTGAPPRERLGGPALGGGAGDRDSRRAAWAASTDSRSGSGPAAERVNHDGQAPLRALGASVLAGLAVWLLVGGVPGAAGGLGTVLVLAVLIGRLEPARVRRERVELIRTAPLVGDLLSASLLAGVPLEQAIPVVARAVGGVSGDALLQVHRRTELGQSPAASWAALEQTPGLGGIARAVMRSSRTGAPLAGLLAQVATDLRADASAAALEQIRATAVRAVLPLGLCLLPAFALLGIAPIIGGLLPSF